MTDTTPADQTIGEIIAQTKGLNPEQVASIARYKNEKGVKFGEAAVALGLASRDEILWALSQQFSYPYELGMSDSELVVATSPFAEAAEFFRDIRTQIIEAVPAHESKGRSIAVCSAQSGDGKTYFAANLAVAFSQLGARTLLVDGDLRAPRLTGLFNIKNSSDGLSAAIARHVSVTAHRPIKSLNNLYVLPVGVIPPNPMELLQSAVFDALCKTLATQFEFIIYDTSAAQHGADCRVIAAHCDANIVIARKGQTGYAATDKLVEQLRKRKPAFIASVINEY